MKINKWTLGLASVGLVSLSPALLAQTAPQNTPLLTALSATTISGYVDTSAVWNPGTGTANVAPYAFNQGKQNGFNLDQIDLKLSKPIEEGKWSAGYDFELSYGPDAQAIDGGAYPIRQAYVDLGVPVGNGLELKLGRFDNLLGYESSDSMNDPNWSRSYAYTFEPTEHTGLLASYKFADWIGLQGGFVDEVSTVGPVNARFESRRGIISLVTLTAPDSWGWVKGSALYGGLDYGPGGANDLTEWYAGLTLNTPVTGLTFGVSWDNISDAALNTTGLPASAQYPAIPAGTYDVGSFDSVAVYTSYKLTDKATLSGRFEYANGSALSALESVNNGLPAGIGRLDKVVAITGTFQYDLWANVISRLEIRWDHNAGGTGRTFGGEANVPAGTFNLNNSPAGIGAPTKNNEVMIAANLIYKF
jgi:hypothetical protein